MAAFTQEEVVHAKQLAEVMREMARSESWVKVDQTFVRRGTAEQNNRHERGTVEQHTAYCKLLGYVEMQPGMFVRSFSGIQAPLGDEVVVKVIRAA
jgi:hypothetical protein